MATPYSTATSTTTTTIPSSSPSTTSPLLVEGGNKALSKRHQQRKNGVSTSSSSSSAAGTGLHKTPSVVLSTLAGSRGRAVAASGSSCCRMLFGPVDHDEVLGWLSERQDDRRRQLTDKYGFDLVLAEEGVYSVGTSSHHALLQQPVGAAATATSSC